MIYIDFYGGTHGNFLRFLINRFVLKLPEYKDFDPFNVSGVAHIFPKNDNTLVRCDHYSFYAMLKDTLLKTMSIEDFQVLPKLNSDDLLIRIHVDFDQDSFVWLYNTLYRALPKYHNIKLNTNNDEDIFLYELCDETKEYVDFCNKDRKCLRNVFYSILKEPQLMFSCTDRANSYHGFIDPPTDNYLDISLDTFSDYKILCEVLTNIAKNQNIVEHDIGSAEMFDIWNYFLKHSGGFYKKQIVDDFFENVVNARPLTIDSLNILQESYLNVLISRRYEIYDTISTFEDHNLKQLSSIGIFKEINRFLDYRKIKYSNLINNSIIY